MLKDENSIHVSVLPTGSGKGWIAVLLSRVLLAKGESNAIVTSDTYLVEQLEDMLGQCKHDFTILNMQQAISRHDEFQCFIIDEADECITHRGVLYDEGKEKVLGFWDVMMKRSYLLTATVESYMQDVLFKLFNLKSDKYANYRVLMSDVQKGCCLTSTNYYVGKTETQYWSIIEDRIRDHRNSKPIIAFVKEKAKASKLKEIAQSNRMRYYEATTDTKLIHFRKYLKEESEGIIVLDRKYGRGSDIRFKVDSYVLVTFIPNDSLELTQLSGRSSRTMKQHCCAVVTQHETMDADNIKHKV